MPVPLLRDARPAWAGSTVSVYGQVQCQEPKKGQQKIQFYCKDEIHCRSGYNLFMEYSRTRFSEDFRETIRENTAHGWCMSCWLTPPPPRRIDVLGHDRDFLTVFSLHPVSPQKCLSHFVNQATRRENLCTF